ncbi:MAG: hypothetical protein GY818_07085 [Planctomycetaceae bacterium]|nr:hypothetical protein [Planctomycetaceae bacterium]
MAKAKEIKTHQDIIIKRGILVKGKSIFPGEKLTVTIAEARRLIGAGKATADLEFKIAKPAEKEKKSK